MKLRLRPRRRARERFEAWQARLYLRLVVLLAAVAYVIAFVLQNHKKTPVHFVFHTAKVSVVWMILLSLAIGLVSGVLLSQLYRRRRSRKELAEAPDTVSDLPPRDEAVGKTG